MPTTIKQLVEKVGLSSADIKEVKWNTPIGCKEEGIYIISLSKNVESNRTIKEIPLSMPILETWIKKLGYFIIDKKETKNSKIIRERLSGFWIPDESILYIGKAPLRKRGGGIGNRVQEYYDTAIGETRPHSGGHWIKLLENLNELHVFYITCEDSKTIEKEMLSQFGKMASKISKNHWLPKGPILPFANLEDGFKQRKKHGLSHMKKNKLKRKYYELERSEEKHYCRV